MFQDGEHAESGESTRMGEHFATAKVPTTPRSATAGLKYGNGRGRKGKTRARMRRTKNVTLYDTYKRNPYKYWD